MPQSLFTQIVCLSSKLVIWWKKASLGVCSLWVVVRQIDSYQVFIRQSSGSHPSAVQTVLEFSFQLLYNLLNVYFVFLQISGFMAVVLVGIWTGHHLGGFAWQSDPKHEFNWHPLLMTLGMIYLYGNGNYSNVKPNSSNYFLCLYNFLLHSYFLAKYFFFKSLQLKPFQN
mgnify:FL=1